MKPILQHALDLIQPRMHVSLGGGHNVADLAHVLALKTELELQFCTPSELTARTLDQLGLTVSDMASIGHIDVAFDGCDSIDHDLLALKSNGGIHSFEKLYAEMADRYVILAPAERLTDTLSTKVPLTVEALPVVADYLIQQILQRGFQVVKRSGTAVASFARTPNGDQLLDVQVEDWRAGLALNDWLIQQNGVVATSLFENVVTDLLTFDSNGQVQEYRKELKHEKI